MIEDTEDRQDADPAPVAVWLTRAEVGERLRVPVPTLAQWATKGTGPRYARIGKHVRYRLADLLVWEQAQMRGGDAA